ncbi:MAG TPA: SDR family NAD(P)-dependent oxidoreductase [Xanthobacteraceae bacterium]|nr:SDR family NAD(P)-dependent oxidoreductase [Xanthobacteraceae bacterium]
MGRLEGKVAIVTGAASGIGRAGAVLFAREGARVVIVDRDADGLNATEAAIVEGGGTTRMYVGDVGHEADVKAYVQVAIERFGALDIVHANAGILGPPAPLLEQTVAQWQDMLQTNLIGPFLAIKHAGAHMVTRGRGSIVLTASTAGLRANAGSAPYSASKAGVISLAQTAANSFLGTGVRVNAICPGLIETGMTRDLFAAARERGTAGKIGQLNPLQRAGTPEEIAAMALFLAGEESSYVNGQAFAVDGGLSSTLPFRLPIR